VIWAMPHTPDNFSHFGSSKGSKDKQAKIDELTNNNV